MPRIWKSNVTGQNFALVEKKVNKYLNLELRLQLQFQFECESIESWKTYGKLWTSAKWCSIWRARCNWCLLVAVAILVGYEQELLLVGARCGRETTCAAAIAVKRLLRLLQLAWKRAGGWHKTIL